MNIKFGHIVTLIAALVGGGYYFNYNNNTTTINNYEVTPPNPPVEDNTPTPTIPPVEDNTPTPTIPPVVNNTPTPPTSYFAPDQDKIGLVGIDTRSGTINLDLYLMSIDNVDELPSKGKKGKSSMIVAKIGNLYHVRSFDDAGKIIIDKGMDEFSPDKTKTLIKQLDKAFSQQPIDKKTKSKLSQQIASTLGHDQEFLAAPWIGVSDLVDQSID